MNHALDPRDEPPVFQMLALLMALFLALFVSLIFNGNAEAAGGKLNIPPPVYLFTEDTIYVLRDSGGFVGEYRVRRDKWEGADVKVQVNGLCKSACTFYLTLPKLCATPEAEFWFHAPFTMGENGEKIIEPKHVAEVLDLYPPKIKQLLLKNGGLTERWLILRGGAVRKYVPSC